MRDVPIGEWISYRLLPLLIATVLVALFVFVLVRLAQYDPTGERDLAIQRAQELFAQKKAEGMDFTDGPCLSEYLMEGWVADIAHFPRRRSDDFPENQCQAYLRGEAQHFVELDPNGKVIRAR